MYFFYNLALFCVSIFLKIIAPFQPKINLFVKGRKDSFSILEKKIAYNDDVIWVHAASLGEFEQGLPVIEKLRDTYPKYKLLLTFFSPSGYEVRKDTNAVDIVCYLPLDSRRNAQKFMSLVRPKIALFIKYEIWPNYLRALEKKKVPAVLISAIFKKEQVFFRWYGGFMRKTLQKIGHFFVQNRTSEELLRSLGLTNITVSGDTRFDRVTEIRETDNYLSFMEHFKNEKKCLIAGSTWPEDEKLLIPYINSSTKRVKYVIAPHNIRKDHVDNLRNALTKKVVLYSESDNQDLADYEVLILDTIGLLTKIYSYGDMAYVGGGFATGLHNTLEPAVFGIPVIIGPRYFGFMEAEELVQQKGILVVNTPDEFSDIADTLLEDDDLRLRAGDTNNAYINKNKGASIQIIQYIRTLL